MSGWTIRREGTQVRHCPIRPSAVIQRPGTGPRPQLRQPPLRTAGPGASWTRQAMTPVAEGPSRPAPAAGTDSPRRAARAAHTAAAHTARARRATGTTLARRQEPVTRATRRPAMACTRRGGLRGASRGPRSRWRARGIRAGGIRAGEVQVRRGRIRRIHAWRGRRQRARQQGDPAQGGPAQGGPAQPFRLPVQAPRAHAQKPQLRGKTGRRLVPRNTYAGHGRE